MTINSLLVYHYIFPSFVIQLVFTCQFAVSVFGWNIYFRFGCIDLIEQFLLILLNNPLTLKLHVMIASLLLFSATFIMQMCFLSLQILVQMFFSLADDHVVLSFQ